MTKSIFSTIGSAIAIAAAFAIVPASTDAAAFTLNINDVYSGDNPAGPTPYLTATFDDSIGGGSVLLTLAAPNLGATEFVSIWGFNLNPAINSGNLLFAQNGPEIGDIDLENFGHTPTGNNYNLGPEKGFQFQFEFQNNDADGGRFQDGESISYILSLSTLAPLTAADFSFPNSYEKNNGDIETSDKISAAHIQGIAPNGSGWVSGGADDIVPPDGTPVPDGGATAVLLGLGVLGLATAARRKS